MELSLRKANRDDDQLLFEWANDSVVREHSFQQDAISWETHSQWFVRKISSDDSAIYIALDEQETPVGQIRLEKDSLDAVISFSIAQNYRGLGYGSTILSVLEQQKNPFIPSSLRLVGHVKKDNLPSIRAFEKNGYQRISDTDHLIFYKDWNTKRPFPSITIRRRTIGAGAPCYIIAEMSANHAGSLERALDIVRSAAESGADCIKIQTYTADTMTLDSNQEWFQIKEGTWKGYHLYQLYQEAYTPWEWHAAIQQEAIRCGLDFLSTPFDHSAVDFLEDLEISFYKIASFELTDHPLLQYTASKGKPIILSTGMATFQEITEAVEVIRAAGNHQICLLKCSSAYPAVAADMNLLTLLHMKEVFQVPVGLSDHSMGSIGAITAVSLGASVVEKHFCISRSIKNPDSTFSMEPKEFKQMVSDIRTAEKAIGKISYDVSKKEAGSRIFRRSLFISSDVKAGEVLTAENVRIVRPAYGLEPKYYDKVLGRRVVRSIEAGTPLSWDLIEE